MSDRAGHYSPFQRQEIYDYLKRRRAEPDGAEPETVNPFVVEREAIRLGMHDLIATMRETGLWTSGSAAGQGIATNPTTSRDS